MSLAGVASVKFEVKSPASKFFQAYIEKINFPKEGNAEIEIDKVGTENKRIRLKMSHFKISKKWYKTLKETVIHDFACYKKLEGTMTVVAKEDDDGADVEWVVDFEKKRSDIQDPHYIVETCVRFFKEMDENLLKST